MINKNFLQEKMKLKQPVLGTWSVIPSAMNIEIIASTGVDFIIIDNEHGSIGFETMHGMILACEMQDVSPLYRPPSISQSDITKAFDLGIHGIQVPNIENRNQVLEIIELAKFPPLGNRGFSPFVRAAGYSRENSFQYYQNANLATVIGINIEGQSAVNNINQFLDIEELDIIFIGAFDISKTLGIPGEISHPRILNIMKQLTKSIIDSGKYAGTISTNEEQIRYYKEIGMNYIVHMVDCDMLRSTYSNIAKFHRNLSCPK